MFDDHEIVNDWAPSHPEEVLYSSAIQPFVHYQLSVNPPTMGGSDTAYTAFSIGRVAFFVLDNRSYRSQQPFRSGEGTTAGFGERTMLGSEQLQRLKQWVHEEGQEKGRLLVVVSGVPFTRNWSKGKDEFDSWAVSTLCRRTLTFRATWTRGKRF
jgi:alkaline phosphatase D